MSRKQKNQVVVEKKPKNVIQQAFAWVFEIVLVVGCAYALVFFFGQSRTNVGQSMGATLQGGDKVLLNRLAYQFSAPKRNDVVAFKPNGSRDVSSVIRRVVGLPGETVQIIDGMLYINESVFLEGKDYPAMTEPGLAENPIALGEKEYFVLGDNRNSSEDSRYADIGTVTLDSIEGKVWFVISPGEHMGFVK